MNSIISTLRLGFRKLLGEKLSTLNFSLGKNLQFGNSFELEVWFVASTIAFLRGSAGIILSISSRDVYGIELLVDVLLTLGFAAAAFSIAFKRVSRIHPAILISLTILLAINFLQFGGVAGSTEYNLLGLGVFIVLACDKKSIKYVLPTYVLLSLTVLLDGYFEGVLTQVLFLEKLQGTEDFYYTSAAIVVLILFYKYALIRESNRLISAKEDLATQLANVKQKWEKLSVQNDEIKASTKEINDEFVHQTKVLVNHNDSIADFAWNASDQIKPKLESLLAEVNEIDGHNILKKIIKDSAKDLQQVTEEISEQLKNYG